SHGGWVATFEDITEQRRLEDERDRNRQFLQQIIDHVPATIIVKNASDRRYVLINKAGEEYFGHSREELIGKVAEEVLPAEMASIVANHDETLLRSNSYHFFDEHPIQSPGKGTRFVTAK